MSKLSPILVVTTTLWLACHSSEPICYDTAPGKSLESHRIFMRWFLPRVTCRLQHDCDDSHSKPDVEEDDLDSDLQRSSEGLGRRG